MKTHTFRRFGGNTLLAIATAAAAILIGLTVTASFSSSGDDPTVDRCVSTADAANGGSVPRCPTGEPIHTGGVTMN
jgi:hypothetical protein